MYLTADQVNYLANEEYFKNIKKNANGRGGYKEGVGYDGVSLTANHFHQVVLDPKELNSLPEHYRKAYSRVQNSWDERFTHPLGEVCFRTMWYAPSVTGEAKAAGRHTDFCALTVPLYDSVYSVGEPFFGQIAEELLGIRAYVHSFRAAKCRRFYWVAFVQFPHDYVINGQRCGDVVTRLCKQYDSTHKRSY